MNFNQLASIIKSVHYSLETSAKQAINTSVTLRNWLLGYYIQEYELGGADRSKYGESLLSNLAGTLQNIGVPATSYRSLRVYKQFYQRYPQFWQTAFAKLKETLADPKLPTNWQTASANLQDRNTAISVIPADILSKSLSFSHFAELIKIDGEYKRCFYELESIKGIEALES